MSDLLELRKVKKAKKPAFVNQDSWKRKVLPTSWRRPRGMHSKMRLKFRGNPKLPSQGYRSPRLVRYAHPSGMRTVLVSSVKQLDALKDEGVIISSVVGVKKKLVIIKTATEQKLKILNLKADYTTKAEAAFAERKKRKSELKTSKLAKETKEAKKPEKKPAKEEKATEEEKRKTSKKEMEKIITKPDK